jgi:hypothetical protein
VEGRRWRGEGAGEKVEEGRWRRGGFYNFEGLTEIAESKSMQGY